MKTQKIRVTGAQLDYLIEQLHLVEPDLASRDALALERHLTDEEFGAYASETLTAEETELLDSHLEECPVCAASMERLVEQVDAWRVAVRARYSMPVLLAATNPDKDINFDGAIWTPIQRRSQTSISTGDSPRQIPSTNQKTAPSSSSAEGRSRGATSETPAVPAGLGTELQRQLAQLQRQLGVACDKLAQWLVGGSQLAVQTAGAATGEQLFKGGERATGIAWRIEPGTDIGELIIELESQNPAFVGVRLKLDRGDWTATATLEQGKIRADSAGAEIVVSPADLAQWELEAELTVRAVADPDAASTA